MAHSKEFIDTTIGNLQILHSRYANEMCNILKRRVGDQQMYDELISINNAVGNIIDILYDYHPYGNTVINDRCNDLTEEEIQSIINYCYKVLNKYNSNIFMPLDANTNL
jgi:hypothetical protein